MASSNYRVKFSGKLHGKSLRDFYGMLDYNVKDLESRKTIVSEICAHPFFMEYFNSKDNSVENQNILVCGIDDGIQQKTKLKKEKTFDANSKVWNYKKTKDMHYLEENELLLHEVEELEGEIEDLKELKTSFGSNKREREYFKANPTTKDILSHEDSTCLFLEKMANYLLFCDDEKEETKDTVMTGRRSKYITEEREILIDEFTEDMVPAYSGNYKLEKHQKLFQSDYKRKDLSILQEYKEGLDFLYERKKRCTTPVDAKKVNGMIGSMKETMIHIKNSYAGTIYFKRVMKDTCEMEEFMIDFREVGHIKALLECSPSSQKWYGSTSMALEQYIVDIRKQIKESDWEVLQLMRAFSGVDDKEIPERMKMDRRDINSAILRIAKLIYKHHMMISEDLWYLNMVKSQWKQCSKCGEIKIVKRFNKESTGQYGVRGDCKECQNSRELM